MNSDSRLLRYALLALLLGAPSACGDGDPLEALDSSLPSVPDSSVPDSSVPDSSLPDSGPPNAPEELLAIGVRGDTALSWKASTNGAVVLGYRVYRDGVEIADVAQTSYLDTFAKTGPPKTCKGHLYKVEAYDVKGNVSAPSVEVRSGLAMKNLIFMIGDGMGPQHQRAAGCYLYGPSYGQVGSQLAFETLPIQGTVKTAAANAAITDSAASGTAMATGVKVNNGTVSIAVPGDGKDLYTLLECFKDQGRLTGLVTTTEISHATPAAFGAHTASRYNVAEIVSDYLKETKPNLLIGGVASVNGITPAAAQAAGYTVVTTRAQLSQLPVGVAYVSGQFSTGHMPWEYGAASQSTNPYDKVPHLHESVAAALKLLGSSAAGFFLLVEGGRIDHAAHGNMLEHTIAETVAFNKAVQTVLQWTKGRSDTLVLVTADHETGGLSVPSCSAKGSYPTVTWSSMYHTDANVNVYTIGPRSKRLKGEHPNTAFFNAITDSGKGK